ncbi:MAG: c-type cytochrome [Acidobacteriota bacterium]|nr:c-type cytochrome [Acidobacteriota bacterium]
MKTLSSIPVLASLVAVLACVGCGNSSSPVRAMETAQRPDQILDATALFKANCAACHGAEGKDGAAIPLANPVLLASAGKDNLLAIVENGVPGSMMPAFSRKAGGMLTDQQVEALVTGMLRNWAHPEQLNGATVPIYASTAPGNAEKGKQVFAHNCARCHGEDGMGATAPPRPNTTDVAVKGSIVDPSYLALITDQGLRNLVIGGRPDRGMPDWRNDADGAGARPMTEEEIADVLAWLVSHRVNAPGQPYAKPFPATGEGHQNQSGEKQ